MCVGCWCPYAVAAVTSALLWVNECGGICHQLASVAVGYSCVVAAWALQAFGTNVTEGRSDSECVLDCKFENLETN